MSTIPIHDAAYKIDANDANLACSTFEDVRLSDCSFKNVTLEGTSFEDVAFSGCTLRRVVLANVNITDGIYDGMTIDGVDVNAMLALYRSQTVDKPLASSESA